MRYRHISIIAIVAAGLATAAGGCTPDNTGGTPTAAATATASPTAATASPEPTEPEATESSGTAPTGHRPEQSAPPAVGVTAACRAAALDVTAIRTGGAMGHVGHDIAVTNTGARACRLIG